MNNTCIDCREKFTARKHACPRGYLYSVRCPACAAAARCDRRFKAARPVVIGRDGTCRMDGCRAAAAHVHHMDAITHGGSNEIENLVGLCQPCHSYIHSTLAHAARTNNAATLRMVESLYSDWAAENAAQAAGRES